MGPVSPGAAACVFTWMLVRDIIARARFRYLDLGQDDDIALIRRFHVDCPRSGGTTEHRDEGPRHLGRLATGIRMRGWENQLMVDKSRDQGRSGRWRPKTNKHMPLTKRRLSPVSASLQRAGAEIFCILPTLVFPIRRSYNIAPL